MAGYSFKSFTVFLLQAQIKADCLGIAVEKIKCSSDSTASFNNIKSLGHEFKLFFISAAGMLGVTLSFTKITPTKSKVVMNISIVSTQLGRSEWVFVECKCQHRYLSLSN